MKSKQGETLAGGLLFLFGVVLLLGGGHALSALPGPALAGAPIALIENGNQCNSVASGQPSACSTGCYLYSCTSLPSASPGVLMGTTDANGNVELDLASYSDGSGYGYYGCNGQTSFVAQQNPPFFLLAAYVGGQWQLQTMQWSPSTVVAQCSGGQVGGTSQLGQPETWSVKDSTTGDVYYVTVTVCLTSCSSPSTVTSSASTYGTTTLTTTVTLTTVQAGTAFVETSTATVTQAVTVTTTQSIVATTTATSTRAVTSTVGTTITTMKVTPACSNPGGVDCGFINKGAPGFLSSSQTIAGILMVMASVPLLAAGHRRVPSG